MHQQAFDYIGQFATDEKLSVVEVGSRDVNFTIRPHFPNANFWGIDAQQGPKVDEIADGATWRPIEPVDMVICAEVFEHTPGWQRIVTNIRRMLVPGGRAVFTCAGPGRAPHGVNVDDPLSPGHYANVSAFQLHRAMLEAGFTDVFVETLGEDTRATGVARNTDDVVITCLLNSFPDPQHGGHWQADLSKLTVLDTVRQHGLKAVVLHDCLTIEALEVPGPRGVLEPEHDSHVTFVRVENTVENAYWSRWKLIAAYLAEANHDFAFCVDANDVTLLHDPFSWMKPDVLYLGSEPIAGSVMERSVGYEWMGEYHPDSIEFIEANADRTLYNGGLLGGDINIVRHFAEDLFTYWPSRDQTDMGALNRVAHDPRWAGRIVTGDLVHTPYWAFTPNAHSWWMHK